MWYAAMLNAATAAICSNDPPTLFHELSSLIASS
jgi:hypothetical protein